jgi:hypothetical protein
LHRDGRLGKNPPLVVRLVPELRLMREKVIFFLTAIWIQIAANAESAVYTPNKKGIFFC